MKRKIFSIYVAALMVTATLLFAVGTVGAEETGYFNGFESESDMDDWNGYYSEIVRVESGHNGVTSADGDYHAVISPALGSAYMWWGGKNDQWPDGGFYTQIDVYLDVDYALSLEVPKQFDFSSAIAGQDGNHHRDYIFHVGTTDDGFIITADNNSNYTNPSTSGDVVASITTSGWYTLRHNFRNDGGILSVEMEVLDSEDNALGSCTRSNSQDTIDTEIGGNYYGWFTQNYFSELAIDNAERGLLVSPVIEVSVDIKPGSDPNSINLKSRGVVPVAILSTEDFDATTVDPATVLFADAAPLRWAFEDVNDDGMTDVIFHFKTQGLAITIDDTEAMLSGETLDGTPIEGSDSITIVPKGRGKGKGR